MSMPILATKLYIPPPRPTIVRRPRLIERLNKGLRSGRKLTLISAPAGFGKTTLLSEWAYSEVRSREYGVREECESVGEASLTPSSLLSAPRFAWLSLDEGDNDLTRFLAYLVSALQTTIADIGEGMLAALQSPQPPPTEWVLTTLLNEIATIPDHFILILDDYHVIEAQAVDASRSVDAALTFTLDHLPPQMHLVIATREDPPVPLARLRARSQLTELRAADLRFTPAEAAEFLNRVMDLDLSAEDIAALERRTEGWIVGLQLAALSMQRHQDAADFIQSFTGSHRFVLDYLLEEVLHQQPENIQTFLLRTSIFDRLCGPLCDAVLQEPSTPGQETLEYLERANLFIVPLDDERRWYRYHHLFAELLRQRLQQSVPPPLSPSTSSGQAPPGGGMKGGSIAELHTRASQWYEDNGLALEAFQHAAAANDLERAERLMGKKGMPLHFRGTVTAILDWLASLPKAIKDARPSLWVRTATLSLVAGQTTGVAESLQAAEAALASSAAPPGAKPDAETRDLIGIIAAARATLALTKYQAEAIVVQAERALAYLRPDNLTFRFTAMWTLGVAHQLQGDRAAAGRALTEALAISQASGDVWSTTLATSGLGEVRELENQLHRAAKLYRRVLQLIGEQPQPNAGEAHLGLARIYYQWNDLDAAQQHGQQSLQLLRQYDRVIDRFILSEVFLARLKLAQGDVAGAAAVLAQAEEAVRQRNFDQRAPEVAAAQVLTMLRLGDLAGAAQLAQKHELPLSQARVHLAQGNPSAALAVLEPLRQQMEARGWQDERLKAMVLQALALHAHGEKDEAVQVLSEALALADPGGFIRLFVDEGEPMAQLLAKAAARGMLPDYTGKLLAAFKAEDKADLTPAQPLIEPLSPRELEVLQLIAQGLSNREIGERLFIALNTVKGHNRRIYGKLGVKNRTQAVNKARSLNILPPPQT